METTKFKVIDVYTSFIKEGDNKGELEALHVSGNSPKINWEKAYYTMLFLEGSPSRKKYLEAAFNVVTELCTQSLNLDNKDQTGLSEQGINLNIAYFLKTFGMFAGYFINSTSWEEQTMHEFDRAEFKSRLYKLIIML